MKAAPREDKVPPAQTFFIPRFVHGRTALPRTGAISAGIDRVLDLGNLGAQLFRYQGSAFGVSSIIGAIAFIGRRARQL